MTLDELNAIPGVTAKPDAATADFVYNHTMIRVKDLQKSLDFYTRVLGFTLLEKKDFPEAEFSLYFLALIADKSQIPADPAARHQWRKSIPGVLELTYNYGTEKDPEFSYHSGNSDPRGFGHLCVSVPASAGSRSVRSTAGCSPRGPRRAWPDRSSSTRSPTRAPPRASPVRRSTSPRSWSWWACSPSGSPRTCSCVPWTRSTT